MRTLSVCLLFILLTSHICIGLSNTKGMVSGQDDKTRVHDIKIVNAIKRGSSGGHGIGGSTGGRRGGTGSRTGVIIVHGGGGSRHGGGHTRNAGVAKDPWTVLVIVTAAAMMAL